MAEIQNIEVSVLVDTSQALAALSDLHDELRDLAREIERVDKRGAKGISVDTNLENLKRELAKAKAQVEAAESGMTLNIDSEVDGFDAAATQAISEGNFGSFTFGRPGGRRKDRRSDLQQIMDHFSGSLGDAVERLRGFNLRMSDIHNAFAAVVPLLIVFIGAIPAAVTALLTLAGAAFAAAGAFATMVGLGAMGAASDGNMPSAEDFQEMFEDVRDSFFEAFAPLAERLEPLFKDGLRGLELFFQAIAEEGDALMALSDEARSFGRFLIEFVPRALRGLAGLAEAFSGVLGNFGRWLNSNIINIIGSFVEITVDALPAIIALTKGIMQALPGIIDLSIGFARIATVIIEVIGWVGKLLTLFGILSGEQIGLVIAGLLSLASAVALVNALIGVFSGTIIAGAISSMANFAASLLFGASAFTALSLTEMAATAALVAFLSVATLGLAFAFGSAIIGWAQNFMGLSESIDTATSSMKEFNRVSGEGTGGDGFNPYGGGGSGSMSGSKSRPNGGVAINIESSGDRQQDKSNGKYAGWHAGRTTGRGA